jgi:uncharacterized protein YcbK (DUF882 family)
MRFTPNNIVGTAHTYEGSYFTWNELTHGMERRPQSQKIVDSLVELTKAIGPYRRRLARPLKVTSGYRPPDVNKLVGGATDSQHIYGNAVDVYAVGLNEVDLFNFFDRSWPGGLGLYDRNGNGWVHIDIGEHRRWSG